MLTSRGFAFLVAVLVVLGAASIGDNAVPGTFALTLLAWFLGQWFLVACRVAFVVPTLHVERSVDDQPTGRGTLWVGRASRIVVRLHCRLRLGMGEVRLDDRAPALGTVTGVASTVGPCGFDQPLELEYSLRTDDPGKARFEGVRLEFGDLQGFFRHVAFLRAPFEALALPALPDRRNHSTSEKRQNDLPVQGIHRYRRPGGGSELLGLREYLPGDPPKSIAWKVSARRDRLMTKEFEIEAPIRCTLFLDASDSVRVGGPGGTALARSVRLAAALGQQLLAVRDPVGLTVFDGESFSVLPAATGRRHLTRMHTSLAQVAAHAPAPSPSRAELLIEPAHRLCRDVFPDLLEKPINRPAPWYTRIFSALAGSSFLNVVVISAAAGALIAIAAVWLDRSGDWPSLALHLLLWMVLLPSAGILVLRRFSNRPRRPRPRYSSRHRKLVAAVVAAKYHLGPGAVSLLTRSDHAFSQAVQRFLIDHQAPFPRPLYGPDGAYLFACPKKLIVLKRLLLRAVAHGRDNELFVLLVDFLELTDEWQPMLEAIKVALARRHQVVVICPWPMGLSPPTRDDLLDHESAGADLQWDRAAHEPHQALYRLDVQRFHRAYRLVRERLSRLGVLVVCAAASDSVDQVLSRVEQLRSAHIRR